jgi:hypothetical protein
MTNYTSSTQNNSLFSKLALFLLVGPFASLYLFNQYLLPNLTSYDFTIAKAMLVLLWSPIFFALPAILMQKTRDAALPQYSGLIGNTVRAFKLLPHIIAQGNRHSIEMVVSLASWVILITLLF